MGFKKKLKKTFRKLPGVQVMKKVGSMFKPKEEGGDDARGEAAQQLMKKNVSRQGGSAQVNFTSEELV
jgi:hypothetical protein